MAHWLVKVKVKGNMCSSEKKSVQLSGVKKVPIQSSVKEELRQKT